MMTCKTKWREARKADKRYGITLVEAARRDDIGYESLHAQAKKITEL
jgi:hypothetical protein